MPTSQQGYSSDRDQSPYSSSQADSLGGSKVDLPGQRAIQSGSGRRCQACDAPTSANQAVCSQCGARLQKRREVIRCRHCGQRASSQLVLCPGCGRELQAASSRLLTVVLPTLVALLFIAALGGQLGGGPLNWFQRQMDGGLQVINNIAITPVHSENVVRTQETPEGNSALIALRPLPLPAATQMTPSQELTEDAEEVGVEPSATDLDERPSLPSGEPEVVRIGEDEEGADEEISGEESAAEEATIASAEPSETPTPTATPLSTETPLPTQTPAPTNTAIATASPIASLRVATEIITPTTVIVTETQTITATAASSQSDIRATLESVRADADLTATAVTSATVAVETPIPTLTPVPSANYTVRTGDTLVEISQRFGIPMQTLIEANGLTTESAANLQVGRVLVLPGVSNLEDERTQTYIVRSGDTFVGIALRFNVNTEALLRANGLNANDARTLQVGQVIVIPTANSSSNTLQVQPAPTLARPVNTPTPAPMQYTIRAGDTVVGIAQRFGTTSQALLALNNLTEAQARRLRPGDVLLIPNR
ncbi:MAG: LysM peptidoglycan-binding domain-containing protein [Caldilineaceae bacterium]|nr:LysM peptidoglycan-binding domain-containing protein [Caldilineaceae bacterium]